MSTWNELTYFVEVGNMLPNFFDGRVNDDCEFKNEARQLVLIDGS